MMHLPLLIAAMIGLPGWPQPAEKASHDAGTRVRSAAEPKAPAPPPVSEYLAEEIAGFRVLMHPSIASLPQDKQGRLRTVLAYDLETIGRTIPGPALEAVRTIPIAITNGAEAMPGYTPRGACFHPSQEWLAAHNLDRGRAGCVEVLSMEDYLDWRSIQPAMIFHELAHAYHWLLGFGRADVAAAFQAARESGNLYRQVAHTLHPSGPPQVAYALTNAQEYFAELSEAYYLRNDIYPFVRAELEDYDPTGARMVRTLWELSTEAIRAESHGGGRSAPSAR